MIECEYPLRVNMSFQYKYKNIKADMVFSLIKVKFYLNIWVCVEIF